uniref:Uncharacterized protein n=1 Tax=Arundo donax TaxID=35708 RepID=A0A0A9E492_ARUDO
MIIIEVSWQGCIIGLNPKSNRLQCNKGMMLKRVQVRPLIGGAVS